MLRTEYEFMYPRAHLQQHACSKVVRLCFASSEHVIAGQMPIPHPLPRTQILHQLRRGGHVKMVQLS